MHVARGDGHPTEELNGRRTSTSYLLSQLGYSAPWLIVYGVAFVLAIVYRGGHRGPRR